MNELVMKGVVRQLTYIADQQDEDIKKIIISIIQTIIAAGCKLSKVGHQHIYLQLLTDDWSVDRLIILFQDPNQESIHSEITNILIQLFKALPLPTEINEEIIKGIKSSKYPDFEQLALLGECPENHDAILANNFEKNLFKDEFNTLESLHIAQSLILFGTEDNRTKVAFTIKDRVKKLAEEKYENELGEMFVLIFDEDKKSEISEQAKNVLSLIVSIEENIKEQKKNIVADLSSIESQLDFLSSLPVSQVKEWNLSPLKTLSINLSVEQGKQLIQKGIIHQISRILDSDVKNVRKTAMIILQTIISAGCQQLKVGELHPFLQPLLDDGTIAKLIELLKDREQAQIHIEIAKIMVQLFKALPLPADISQICIKKIKNTRYPDYDGLALLAECPDNHNAILANNIEKDLFKDEFNTLESLHIAYSLLMFGTDSIKRKVSQAVKDKVKKLADDIYVHELGEVYQFIFDEQKKQEIKNIAQDVFAMIVDVDEQIKESQQTNEERKKKDQVDREVEDEGEIKTDFSFLNTIQRSLLENNRVKIQEKEKEKEKDNVNVNFLSNLNNKDKEKEQQETGKLNIADNQAEKKDFDRQYVHVRDKSKQSIQDKDKQPILSQDQIKEEKKGTLKKKEKELIKQVIQPTKEKKKLAEQETNKEKQQENQSGSLKSKFREGLQFKCIK
ncbi:MAG: hypothetical protein EZS28_034391, partial [Streblomastix strix]